MTMHPRARLGITDEELVEQIKENPCFQFFIGLEGFQDAAPLIGQGKRRLGLGLIREELAAVTQGFTIALNVLVMNLEKLLWTQNVVGFVAVWRQNPRNLQRDDQEACSRNSTFCWRST